MNQSPNGIGQRVSSEIAGHTAASAEAANAHARDRIRSEMAAPSLLWELRYIATWPWRLARRALRRR